MNFIEPISKKVRSKRPLIPKEKNVHQQVADYLKFQYPDVIFLSDASGMRVSMGLRMELKRKRCIKYKIPDMIILHPANGYHGLIIEIKKDLSEIYTKELNLKNKFYEQKKSLHKLSELGYKAVFGCGFDHCKKVIDEYLNGNEPA